MQPAKKAQATVWVIFMTWSLVITYPWLSKRSLGMRANTTSITR
jgi:hypothetical protein